MNTESIVILVIVASFIACLGAVIIIRGILINKAEKKAKQPKEDTSKKEKVEEPKIVEEKPLPVGIVKTDTPKVEQKQIDDFAPFRENKEVETVKEEVKQEKSISQQIKDLSPEMKAILFSDVIKPKF